jgi:hypothetical protein
VRRRSARTAAADHGRPPCRAVDDAEEWADREVEPQVQPRLQLLPAPLVHADLSAAAALAAPDKQRAAAAVQARLAKRQRLVDAQPGPPKHDDHTAQPTSVTAIAGRPHDGDDLLDGRRVGRIAQALVAGRATDVETRHGRRRATSTGTIKQQLRHDPSSGSYDEPRIDPHSARQRDRDGGKNMRAAPRSKRKLSEPGFTPIGLPVLVQSGAFRRSQQKRSHARFTRREARASAT